MLNDIVNENIVMMTSEIVKLLNNKCVQLKTINYYLFWFNISFEQSLL